MKKPAVYNVKGRRFWTPERFVMLFALILSPLGFCFYFFGGLITVPWAIGMWNRAWRNPNYGYRTDGTMKTGIFSEMY